MHPREEQLNEYVDGTLDAAEQAGVAGHLDQCAECALLVAELQHIVREARGLPLVTPPAEVWARVRTARLARVDAQHARTPLWALATAAAVVFAFLAGQVLERRHQRDADTPRAQAVSPGGPGDVDSVSNVRQRVLQMAIEDHLERSQMVLVELANAQTSGQLDISTERQTAEELLASNRLYRQTAVQLGQTSVAGVLDELERVLVEVARGPSQVSTAQLEEIQQRIDAQGILFKMKIVNSTITGRKAPVS